MFVFDVWNYQVYTQSTRRLYEVILWARIKDGAYISSSSPGGGTGREVCHIQLRTLER